MRALALVLSEEPLTSAASLQYLVSLYHAGWLPRGLHFRLETGGAVVDDQKLGVRDQGHLAEFFQKMLAGAGHGARAALETTEAALKQRRSFGLTAP